MKKRLYHYFFEDNTKQQVQDKLDFQDKGTLYYRNIEIECFDSYEGELELFAIPIKYLHHFDTFLEQNNLSCNIEDFFDQCREVIAVPEKHQDEKGTEGKMNFQAYFHDFPASLESINDRAIVVVALAPIKDKLDADGKRLYKVAAYVHANEFDFMPNDGSKELLPGYYYNMLRVSEERKDGKQIYRRTGVFSTVFGVLLDLTRQNEVHYVYATMGKENTKIKNALVKLATDYHKEHDFFSTSSNSKLTSIHGSSKYKKQLIDITNNKEQLEILYHKNQKITAKHLFNQFPTFEDFLHTFNRVISYSKSTKAFMLADKDGKMTAACIAVNWGDYFSFNLDNPKGIFVLLEKLKLTEKLLYAWLTVGEPTEVSKLYKGLSKYYKENHDIKMFILASYKGDPYHKIKDSLFNDPTNYFVIHDRPEDYKRYKENSKDADGNVRIFIDTVML